MKISKITSAFNHAIYLLIPIILFLIYLNHFSYEVLFLLVLSIIFMFKKECLLCLIVILSIFIFYFKYQTDYEHINTKLARNFVCEIYSIPQYKDLKHKFYCRNKDLNVLVEYQDEYYLVELKIGQIVALDGQVNHIKKNTVPNQTNFANYYLSKKVAYRIYGEEIKIVKEVSKLNYKLINFILDYYEDAEYKEYVYALLIGSRSEFDDEVNTSINNLNISHLFVVSGFQVNFLYMIMKKCLKYFKVTIEKSNSLINLLLVGFMILNNFATSIVRAVIFIILVNIKNKFHLNISNINVLSIVCFINLYINPFLIYDTGFQLSYLITFVLLMSHKLLYSKNKWLSPFKISLIAQLFSLPITANFDFSFNFLSVFLSPVLGLYYTYIIFPVSIFLTFFKKSEVFLKYFIIFFEELIFLFNKITILDYNIGYFSVLRTCFYYFCLYHILKNLEVKKKIKQISFIFLLVMLFYHKFSIIDEVTYIDVGQGDSALIKSDSNNCTAIIDTGGIGDFSSSTYHPGERNVVPYLKSMQMSTLDYLFISHSDEDHAGDYKYIIDQINVKNIVLNKFDTSDLGNEIKKVASENGINVIEIQAYHKVRCGEIEINVLNPFNDSNTGNDNSLVLFFVFNGDHFLFTGDIGQSIEEELINDYQLNVDYLKISHHV